MPRALGPVGAGIPPVLSVAGDLLTYASGVYTRLPIGDDGDALVVDAGTLVWAPIAAASGDVVGPASATDLSVCVFDGITGKLVKGSPLSVSSTGKLSGMPTPTTDGAVRTGPAQTITLAGSLGLATAYLSSYTGGAGIDGSADFSAMRISSHSTTGTRSSWLVAANNGAGAYASVSSGQEIHAEVFYGYSSSGTAYFRNCMAVTYEIDGALAASNFPGRVVWTVVNSAGTSAERMRLNGSQLTMSVPIAFSGGANTTTLANLFSGTALDVAKGGIGAEAAGLSTVQGIEHKIASCFVRFAEARMVATTTDLQSTGNVEFSANISGQAFTSAVITSLRPFVQWRTTPTTTLAYGVSTVSAVSNQVFETTSTIYDYYIEGGFAVSDVTNLRAGFGWHAATTTLYAAYTSTALGARIVIDTGAIYGSVGNGSSNWNVLFTTTPVADTVYRFGIRISAGLTTFTLRNKYGVVLETKTVAGTIAIGSGSYVGVGEQALAQTAGTYYIYPADIFIDYMV